MHPENVIKYASLKLGFAHLVEFKFTECALKTSKHKVFMLALGDYRSTP